VKNYYHSLGVTKSATADEIKRAYRKLALEYHPDRHNGDDTKFKGISEAYAVLKDPAKRKAHDLELKEDSAKHKTGSTAGAAAARKTSAADFSGPDPASEKGQWDDTQSTGASSAQFSGYYRVGPQFSLSDLLGAPFRMWRRPITWILLLAVTAWAFYVVGTHFTSFGSGAPTPFPTPIQTPTPQSVGSAPGISDATPSPTPATCPTGAPTITVTSDTPNDNGAFRGDNQDYTISGTVTNSSTGAINIGSVGFYFGDYDASLPPDTTETFANMAPSSEVPVEPGSTINWSVNVSMPQAPTGQTVASINYPVAAGAASTPQWYFSDSSVPSNCQPLGSSQG
jgi:hypothetical protein